MASLLDGFSSLFSGVNRVKQDIESKQGVSSDLLPELTTSLSDEELITLTDSWMSAWIKEQGSLQQRQKTNIDYWKGKFSYSDLEMKGEDRPEADNLIFQSLETFLPLVSRQNPEPTVDCDNLEQANIVKEKLADLADELKLKLKIRAVVRNWALSLVGVGKICWDIKNNRIDFKAIQPGTLILDPKAYVEGGIYHGRFLGEYKTESASDVAIKFPKKKEYITKLAQGKMATDITYIEWWTEEVLFWTCKGEVLDKSKNPNWNYEGAPQVVTDEYGMQSEQPTEPKNHLPYPQIPYAFLTVFSLGDHPWDDTSLVEQNLYLQDLIHKRLKQININNDIINGGLVISAKSGLSAEQATLAADAFRLGGAVYLSAMNANASEDIQSVKGEPLPTSVYESLIDYRNELRGIFGTQGSVPEGIQQEKTVRGKILSRGSDDSRNSMVTEYIEQFADYVFNWFVQMLYVYSDEQFMSAMQLPMVVSMKEGSLIPKDSLTKANQAVDLWTAGAIAPKDLFEKLEEPDPNEEVVRLVEWKQFESNPMMGLPSAGIAPVAMAPPPGSPMGNQGSPQNSDVGMPEAGSSPDILNQVPLQ